MNASGRRVGGTARRLARLALVAALLVPAAAAARRGVDGHSRVRADVPPELIVGLLVAAGLLATLVTAASLLAVPRAMPVDASRRRAESRRHAAGPLIPAVVTAAALLLATVAIVSAGRHPTPRVSVPSVPAPRSVTAEPERGHGGTRWIVIAGLTTGTLVLAAAWLLRPGRAPGRDTRPFRHAGGTVEPRPPAAYDPGSLPEAPREAVLAAYARMEELLGVEGKGRRPNEAPWGYWRRLAPMLDVAARDAALLTRLYERAAFAVRDPNQTDRRHAESALSSLERRERTR
jgi:hypothetical protein